MTDHTTPEPGPCPPPGQTDAARFADRLHTLETIVYRVREAVGTDEPAVSAAGPATPTDTDPTGLRQRIAETLTAKAYECDGKCGLSERECYDAHPITFSAMCNGTTHIDAPVTAIADAVLAVLPAPADRAAVLREAADWYAQQGKVVLAASQVAADLRRRADAEPRRMADETAATETPTEEPICSDEPPRDGTWGDCWCTLPPGHDGEHRCQPCTDRHGAPGWTDPAAAQPAGGEQ